jgi:hypothetical protein
MYRVSQCSIITKANYHMYLMKVLCGRNISRNFKLKHEIIGDLTINL